MPQNCRFCRFGASSGRKRGVWESEKSGIVKNSAVRKPTKYSRQPIAHYHPSAFGMLPVEDHMDLMCKS